MSIYLLGKFSLSRAGCARVIVMRLRRENIPIQIYTVWEPKKQKPRSEMVCKTISNLSSFGSIRPELRNQCLEAYWLCKYNINFVDDLFVS